MMMRGVIECTHFCLSVLTKRNGGSKNAKGQKEEVCKRASSADVQV